MNVAIRAMTVDDYPAVTELWRQTEGIGLNESDSEDAVGLFLRRNPGMSAIAVSSSNELLGAVLCGHDGRRGYLHHLAVAPSHRKQGIASHLIAWCFGHLATEMIPKCNVFLLNSNESGASFWQHNGWSPRHDLRVFQKEVVGDST
jgi:putative acetyltransferase